MDSHNMDLQILDTLKFLDIQPPLNPSYLDITNSQLFVSVVQKLNYIDDVFIK